MKYYLYQSVSKVDMILPQISKEYLTGIAVELGFDWKILSAKLTKEFNTRDNRTKRLEAVVAYINKKKNPKPFDEDSSWIRGKLRMTSFELTENHDVIFYLGETQQTILLLGGSSIHLIGGDKKENIKGGLSHTHRLIKSLNDNIMQMDFNDSELELMDNSIGDGSQIKPWKNQVRLLRHQKSFDFKQEYEFLARRLVRDTIEGKVFVLATPLYVAFAE